MNFPPNYQQGKQSRLASYMVHGATEDEPYIKRSQSSESLETLSGQGAGNVGRHRNGAKKTHLESQVFIEFLQTWKS